MAYGLTRSAVGADGADAGKKKWEFAVSFSKKHSLVLFAAAMCAACFPFALAYLGEKWFVGDNALGLLMPTFCSWTLALALLVLGFVALFRLPWRSYRAGCCRNCGYDLRGSASGNCPECGAGADRATAREGEWGRDPPKG